MNNLPYFSQGFLNKLVYFSAIFFSILVVFFIVSGSAFADDSQALALQNRIIGPLCIVIDFLTGTGGKAIGTFVVVISTVSFAFGKIQKETVVVIVTSVSCVFLSPEIVNLMAGKEQQEICNEKQ